MILERTFTMRKKWREKLMAQIRFKGNKRNKTEKWKWKHEKRTSNTESKAENWTQKSTHERNLKENKVIFITFWNNPSYQIRNIKASKY